MTEKKGAKWNVWVPVVAAIAGVISAVSPFVLSAGEQELVADQRNRIHQVCKQGAKLGADAVIMSPDSVLQSTSDELYALTFGEAELVLNQQSQTRLHQLHSYSQGCSQDTDLECTSGGLNLRLVRFTKACKAQLSELT